MWRKTAYLEHSLAIQVNETVITGFIFIILGEGKENRFPCCVPKKDMNITHNTGMEGFKYVAQSTLNDSVFFFFFKKRRGFQ